MAQKVVDYFFVVSNVHTLMICADWLKVPVYSMKAEDVSLFDTVGTDALLRCTL